MSKLTELLSKGTPEKATAIEADELSELTGKSIPADIYDILSTGTGLAAATWIIEKRNTPNIAIEEISKQITIENRAELEWEMFFTFSGSTRQDIDTLRKGQNNQNITPFSTSDYKQFADIVKQVDEFMKANKGAKFTATIVCEKVEVDDSKNVQEVESQ